MDSQDDQSATDFQTIAHMEKISKELRESIIGNTWTKVLLKMESEERRG